MNKEPELKAQNENIEASFKVSKSLLSLQQFCTSCQEYNTFTHIESVPKPTVRTNKSRNFIIFISLLLLICLPFLIPLIPLILLISVFIRSKIKKEEDEVCSNCKQAGTYINLKTIEGLKKHSEYIKNK